MLFLPCFASASPAADSLFQNNVKKWFAAWELLSKEVYGLKKTIPVQFVFFDNDYVYSNSSKIVA